MSVELKIPEIGESIAEVVIGEWLKAEGDHVERDEDVVVVESDKATVQIPAPDSGQLVKILKRSGETAAVGEAIGRLEAEESKTSESTGAPPKQNDASASEAADKGQTDAEEENDDRETEGIERAAPATARKESKDKDTDTETESTEWKKREMPDADEEKEENKVAVEGEADERRDMAEDKKREDAEKEKDEAKKAGARQPKPIEIEPTEVSLPAQGSSRDEEVIPMSPIRQRIAERLVHAQQTTAFLSTFNEIDMSAVKAIRQKYQDEFQKRHAIKLGLMPFFVKASIEALKLIPQVNAEIRGTNIAYRNYYDIGVAVGGGKGLVVPVLCNADRISFAEVERAIQEFARKAERNQLKPDDLDGGTFTISNGGIYGSLLSTPIINAPQSGILGMHAIQERAVVRDGQVVIRPMMYVALTYDHRIVDGREAVTFLKRIKECVEAPSRILLEI